MAFGILSSVGLKLDNQRNTIVFGPNPQPEWVYSILGPLVQWDSLHFLNIATRGYDSVLEHAFLPGLPIVMRLMSVVLPYYATNPTLSVALAGVLFVQLSFILGALGLFKISRFFLGDTAHAFRVTLFYIFASSNVFMSALYTESPFSMLTFWGIYWLYVRKRVWISVVLFSLSALFRSNGLLAAGFVIHESLRNRRSFEGILGALCVYLPYSLYSTWSYNLYCDVSIGGTRQDWCDSYPSIYVFIQKAFWNVSPFGYWKLSNLPYFLLMTPSLIVSIHGIHGFLRERSSILRSLLMFEGPVIINIKRVVDIKELGFVCQMTILTILTVCIANCQILTRILSSCPLYFWSLERLHRRASEPLRSIILAVNLGYYLIGPLLFGNGFNWT